MAEVQTKLLMHLLIQDDEGSIHSAPGGTGFKIGSESRWRFACRPNAETSVHDELNRSTTEPWFVKCNACEATADFQAINRPKPGTRHAGLDQPADGCCN